MIFGNPEGPQASIEATLVALLKNRGQTFAVAESCTGGLVASRVTDIAGASEVFSGGVVCYSNALKIKLLNVPEAIITNYGAVSEACAIAMVKGLKALTHADYCTAVTGIAGPAGGTPEKPVGTVFVAEYFNEVPVCHRLFFPLSRLEFKQRVADAVMLGVAGALRK
ncbi:MAG: CinA family protein [Deltaproteobacteria bacterium]|nr:CinA family protein [Deltaproteobacteria bacterium]